MRLAIFLLFTTSCTLLFGQERCGTKTAHAHVHEFEDWLSSRIRQRKADPRMRAQDAMGVVYEIPVVVHVISPANGNDLGITDERIVRQIEILNEDFGRTNADTMDTPMAFKPVAADTEIQFTLAKRDPAGNPSNGIVRVSGPRNRYNPSNFEHKTILRLLSYWPPEHYLNVYVTDLSGFLGLSSFPTTDLEGIDNEAEDYIFDAIWVDFQYFGENPSAPSFESFGRTTTHEVGHYFGLRHIWGDGGCLFDDFVLDTPIADSDNDGLGSPCDWPNPDDPVVCVPDEFEMFQNYMDYTNDVCMNLFTEGQKTRMRTVIDNAPRRTSLLSSPALLAPTRFSDDLAIKRINAPFHAICANQIIPEVEVVNFGDNEVTSYDISLLINGVVAQTVNQTTSIDTFATEVVTFTSEFVVSTPTTVKFLVENVNATSDGNPINNTDSITISSTSSILTPFTEDFETTNKLLGTFEPAHPWEVLTAPDANGNNRALAFKAYNNFTAFDEKTLFTTPIFDLTGIVSAGIIFNYAHARRPDGFRDGLAVKISTDCGATFEETLLYVDFGDSLQTAPETNSLFVPSGETEWKRDTISLVEGEGFANRDGIQIAFVGMNGGGNHIYLDDISVQQIDKNPNDASLISISAPPTTCNETTTIDFEVRNVGFEEITSLSMSYTINNNTTPFLISETLIPADEIRTFSITVPIEDGDNMLVLTINEVNGQMDEGLSNNSLDYVINRDASNVSYPTIVDFERPYAWTINPSTSTQIWNETNVSGNNVLYANAFDQPQEGIEDWFISPEILITDVDTAGLSFKISYAERVGFSDRLQVLLSQDCGESYFVTLLDALSDSLAVTETDVAWVPSSESDWVEYTIDIKDYIPNNGRGLRIAFVFTNGNGNNLYLDDINLGLKPIFPDVATDQFKLYPNPAFQRFNIAFSLAEREDVEIQIIDLSGRVIFQQSYSNVIDQVYDLFAPAQSGFYFVKIVGSKINQTQRLYIRR